MQVLVVPTINAGNTGNNQLKIEQYSEHGIIKHDVCCMYRRREANIA